MREFIKQNRQELDDCIQRACPGARKNDEERKLWIMNDEGLYMWARKSGVKI